MLIPASVVAPRAGAWIETDDPDYIFQRLHVAPRAGAWIETREVPRGEGRPKSPPARGRGLKHRLLEAKDCSIGRPPRGGVD